MGKDVKVEDNNININKDAQLKNNDDNLINNNNDNKNNKISDKMELMKEILEMLDNGTFYVHVKDTRVENEDPYTFQGIFDNIETFLKAIPEEYGDEFAVSVCVNPVKVLGDIEINKLEQYRPENSSLICNSNVTKIGWIVLSIKTDLRGLGEKIEGTLRNNYHFPEGLVIANLYGYDILYKVDFEASRESDYLVDKAVEALNLVSQLDKAKNEKIFQSRCSRLNMLTLPRNKSGKKEITIVKLFNTKNPVILKLETIKSMISRIKSGLRNKHNLRNYDSNDEELATQDWINEYLSGFTPYIDEETKEPCVDIEELTSNNVKTYFDDDILDRVETQFFKERNRYFMKKTELPLIRKQLSKLFDKAMCEGHIEKAHKRIAQVANTLFYDLNNEDGHVIEIDPIAGVNLRDKNNEAIRELHFRASDEMIEQVGYEKTDESLLELLRPFINNMNDRNKRLFITILLSYFVDLPHAFLWLSGKQGTGKTFLTKLVQNIVDPINTEPGLMPQSSKDLIVHLGTRYMVVFDNLDVIKSHYSDILCQAVNGGSMTDRKLYTDKTTSVIRFKNVVIINGIPSDIVSKPDLLQRMVAIKTLSIENRKTEEELLGELKEKMPRIMYAIFDALSKTLAVLPDIEAPTIFRLADSSRFCAAASKVLWGNEEQFIDDYKHCNEEADLDIIENDPSTNAVFGHLRSKCIEKYPYQPDWKSSTDFFEEVKNYAEASGDKLRQTRACELTKKIKDYQENFKNMGITFEFDRQASGCRIKVEVSKNIAKTA